MSQTILLIDRDGAIRPTGTVPERHYGHWPAYWRVMKAKPLRAFDASDVPMQQPLPDITTYRLVADTEPYVIYEEFSR